MMVTKALALTTVAALLLLGNATCSWAQANTAVGKWSLTFFDDNDPGMSQLATQEICIRPDRTWYSTTFPNWGGRWFQKGTNPAGIGDHVRLFGVFGGGTGADAAELDFVNVDLMTGPWAVWRTDLTYEGFRRNRVTRLARDCPALNLTAAEVAAGAKEKGTPDAAKPKG